MPILINVCGASRSGTTILDLMLGNSEESISLGEIYAFFRPWRKHHFKPVCSCENPRCEFLNKLKNISEAGLHREIFNTFKVNFIIDSSKNLNWIYDNNNWSRFSKIDVVNILIYKNPIEYCFSMWKRNRNLVSWKKQFITYHKRFFSTKLDFISVNYNQFFNDPKKNLQRLCKIIGIDYFPGKECFWEKQHHHLFGSYGVRQQIENKSQKLHKSTQYPKEFLNQYEILAENFENNKELLKIYERLNIRSFQNFSEAVLVSKEFANKLPPTWYFIEKFKIPIKKRFPQKTLINNNI